MIAEVYEGAVELKQPRGSVHMAKRLDQNSALIIFDNDGYPVPIKLVFDGTKMTIYSLPIEKEENG